jgi:hypothetical protein
VIVEKTTNGPFVKRSTAQLALSGDIGSSNS